MALKDQLEGWETQLGLTEQWLRGEFEIPEIRDKWSHGPIVKLAATAPETVTSGQNIPLRVVMASNKVGHDFPTGPLDIIQSRLEITVVDDAGQIIWTSGKRDARHFLEPGTFLFKAEPVDQHGNLIDRHNLWEMVGVRFRRALFLLGEVSLLRGQFALAETRLNSVCQSNPKAAGAFFLRGYLAWKSGDVPASTGFLLRAREALGPDWQPQGATSEGDVRAKQHDEVNLLAPFWQTWTGEAQAGTAFAALESYLNQRLAAK